MKKWNPYEKPPAHVCPQRYCFSWVEKGDFFAPGLYNNVEEALTNTTQAEEGYCGWSLSICTRLDPVNGKADYYEPDESNLAEDGLPWFYFMRDVHAVNHELKEEYIRESEKLWGKAKQA